MKITAKTRSQKQSDIDARAELREDFRVGLITREQYQAAVDAQIDSTEPTEDSADMGLTAWACRDAPSYGDDEVILVEAQSAEEAAEAYAREYMAEDLLKAGRTQVWVRGASSHSCYEVTAETRLLVKRVSAVVSVTFTNSAAEIFGVGQRPYSFESDAVQSDED